MDSSSRPMVGCGCDCDTIVTAAKKKNGEILWIVDLQCRHEKWVLSKLQHDRQRLIHSVNWNVVVSSISFLSVAFVKSLSTLVESLLSWFKLLSDGRV